MMALRKGHGLDKFDGYIPKRHDFLHDNYNVSYQQESFSIRSGYAWDHAGKRRGFSYGVDKKIWKASGRGINVDSQDIGKSDT